MKIALILLAAGNSKRFKENKLLHVINGIPMFMHIVNACEQAPFFEKIIVTQYDKIANLMHEKEYRIVRNSQPHLGISHSIRLGLLECSKQCDAYCFSVCDQPNLSAKTMTNFINGFVNSGKSLGSVAYNDIAYNPNIFSQKYYNELLALSGDKGAKSIIKSADKRELFLCNVENKLEITDIDNRDSCQ